MSGPVRQSGTAVVNSQLTIGDRKLSMKVSVPAGPTRLGELLPIVQRIADQIVDGAVEDTEAQGACVSCKMGCGACCRQLVPISEVEARSIRDVVERMPEPRRTQVRARFAETQGRLAEAGLLSKLLARDDWDENEFIEMGTRYFRQGIACPFLEDESCSIHADRPITCREYLVTSPADNCACPTKDNIQKVDLPVQIWTSLARFDMVNPDAKYIRWVPLVLAPQWADANPEKPPSESGPELLRKFFEFLAKKKTPQPAALLKGPGDGTSAPNPANGPASPPRDGSSETASPANLTSYEDVPYESQAHYPTHPDCIATVATLFGMQPAAPDRCRLLELGCATGGNLLPMAELLPESRFLGIDLSPSQIASGRKVADALALANVELKAASIMDVDESYGQFDYITCHGVFSWVGEEVQQKILDICAKHLAPQGVAYISYNTLPGWHARGMVREMISFHAQQFDEPATRVEQARAFLEFLVQSSAASGEAYAAVLQEEAKTLRESEDYYLFHEHLEEVNQPLYFHQFAERLGRHRLQYLGEAWFHSDLSAFPPEVQNVLRGISSDPLLTEQYLDFLTNRTFRRSLICREDVPLDRTPDSAIVRRMQVTALARPVSEPVDVRGGAEAAFRTDEGRTITTGNPLFKAALMALFEAWPAALAYDELLSQALDRLGSPDSTAGATHDEVLRALLLRCFLSHTVALHVQAPKMLLDAGPRPRTTRLARYQAERGSPVVSVRHWTVPLGAADRAVLTCLDGEHDRAAIIARLEHLMREEGLRLGDGAGDGKEAAGPLAEWLEGRLYRLAKCGLLVG